MSKLYRKLTLLLAAIRNHATIHSTKFALLTLFAVTAIMPNMMNSILFIMFLMLAMSNNSQAQFYWRLTIGLVSLFIIAQYGFRVFTQNEVLMKLKASQGKICFTGLIICTEIGETSN